VSWTRVLTHVVPEGTARVASDQPKIVRLVGRSPANRSIGHVDVTSAININTCILVQIDCQIVW
jgi:hypothetical protein